MIGGRRYLLRGANGAGDFGVAPAEQTGVVTARSTPGSARPRDVRSRGGDVLVAVCTRERGAGWSWQDAARRTW